MIATCLRCAFYTDTEHSTRLWGLPNTCCPGCHRFHMAGEGGGGKSSPGSGGDLSLDADLDLSSLDNDLDMDLSGLEMDLDGGSDSDALAQGGAQGRAQANTDSLDVSDLALDRPTQPKSLGEDLPDLDTDLNFGDSYTPDEDTFDLDVDLPELEDDLGTPELEDQLAENLAFVSKVVPGPKATEIDLPDLEDELGDQLVESVGDLNAVEPDSDFSSRDDGLGLPELDMVPEDNMAGEDILEEVGDELDKELPELDMGLPDMEGDTADDSASGFSEDDALEIPDMDMDLPDMDSATDSLSAGGQDANELGLPDLDDASNDLEEQDHDSNELGLPDLDDISSNIDLQEADNDGLGLPDLEGISEAQTIQEGESLDLSDLDSMPDGLDAPDDGPLNLDLPGFDDLEDDLAAGAPQEVDEPADALPELELGDTMTMDMEGVKEPEVAADSADLDVDLGDMDTLEDLKMQDDDDESTGDLDLELELEDMGSAEDSTPLPLEDSTNDLELDLDSFSDDGEITAPGDVEDADDLGLGEMDLTEELLIPDTEDDSSGLGEDFDLEIDDLTAGTGKAPAKNSPVSDLDLGDLEMEPEAELEMTEEEATEEMSIDLDSFDLTMDSGAPEPTSPQKTGDEGMDLDFDMDMDGDSHSDDGGMDLDIDLEGEIASDGLEVQMVDDDEQDVDMEINEDTDDFHVDAPIGDAIQTMEFTREDRGIETMEMEPGDTMELPAEAMDAGYQNAGPPPPPLDDDEDEEIAPVSPKKKGVSKFLIFVLLLLILLGGGFAAVKYLGIQLPFEIPFVSEFLGLESPKPQPAAMPTPVKPKPAPQPVQPKPMVAPRPETAMPAPAATSPAITGQINFGPSEHHWVQGADGQWMLVVTGQVENGYNAPCSYIRLKGILKDANGATLTQVMVYAGNPLSDARLANMSQAEIKLSMSNKAGVQNSNLGVAPNGVLEYTVAFFNPPEALDSVDVLLAGAQPGQ
ncbi:MAG: DUF3426 domain-containing protein [Desulfatibacillum sp.]|nr:DUF3426 domain-containing protein [Desulfatibacillum sp.]